MIPLHLGFFKDFLWDTFCVLSIIGIWPRFIEPRLLKKTKLTLSIPSFPRELLGLKIVQISDLHLRKNTSWQWLDRITRCVNQENPDLIVFTGDFLCFSKLHHPEMLLKFLNSFKASFGHFAVLGNHDLSAPITINAQGDYALLEEKSHFLKTAFCRLWSTQKPTGIASSSVKALLPHPDLISLLKQTPFQLLNNASFCLPIKKSYLNVVGVGEHMAGQDLKTTAFSAYHPDYPGLILAHNPDAVQSLLPYPGELILCGHTHGGQVNLPKIGEKFTLLEDPSLKRGLKKRQKKWIYINRGLGGVIDFRWFASPEITVIQIGH